MAAVEPTLFRWPFDDFDDRFEKTTCGEAWESPDFEVDGIPKAKFYVSFYPKGCDEKYRNSCALYLHVRDFGDHPAIRLTNDYWLENGTKEQLKRKGSECEYNPIVTKTGWSKMCTQAQLLDLAKAGPLVLFCKILALNPVDFVEWAERTAPLGVFRKIAANFDSKKFADIEVRVQGRVFPVNKMIVCSGSPVFDRMFTLDTKEKQTGVVEIEKEDADLIELLLRFLYAGEVEELAEVAPRLLPVADCYEVLGLAEMCLASLVKNLSVSTLVRDLKLAFAHDHQGAFKRKVLTFARKNLEQLQQEPAWNLDFFREHPEVAFEVTLASSP